MFNPRKCEQWLSKKKINRLNDGYKYAPTWWFNVASPSVAFIGIQLTKLGKKNTNQLDGRNPADGKNMTGWWFGTFF